MAALTVAPTAAPARAPAAPPIKPRRVKPGRTVSVPCVDDSLYPGLS
jgi:hypothetical protein